MLGKTKSAGNLIKEYKMNIQLRGSLYETFKGIQRRTVISDSVNEHVSKNFTTEPDRKLKVNLLVLLRLCPPVIAAF